LAPASHVDVKNGPSNVPGLCAAVKAISANQLSVDAYITMCLRRVEADESRIRAFAQCDRGYVEKRAYVSVSGGDKLVHGSGGI